MHEDDGEPNTKSAVPGTWGVVEGKQEGFPPAGASPADVDERRRPVLAPMGPSAATTQWSGLVKPPPRLPDAATRRVPSTNVSEMIAAMIR